jgi:hypothetical protein
VTSRSPIAFCRSPVVVSVRAIAVTAASFGDPK